ncbi:carboxyl-terminal processing protease [Minicystis rosea]|nr:carboxyl-terminal processing protease [Minicystis rosea]
MLPASTRAQGMSLAFPNVRPTPAGPAVVPIPYVNLAKNAASIAFSPNVVLSGANALNLRSKVPRTLGAEPALPPNDLAGGYIAGNPVVQINNLPGINLACPASGDSMNAFGAVLFPSTTNVLYTLAPKDTERRDEADGDPYARSLDEEALADLASCGSHGPSVESHLSAEGVGHIALRAFTADVPARVFSAIRAMTAEGMRELVIDLRDNPGGEETAFVELASDFLDAGSVVVTRLDGHGDETVLRSRHEAVYRMPVTLVVNRGTASAAELFAGCLKAHGRAKVIGERTYGKGVGQAVRVTAEGSVRAVSEVRYRLPDGGEVEGVEVEMEAGPAEHERESMS